ncbi:MAG: DUF4595 domain-containing protein [Chitinophagaceae bacterium]|nr:DUF4595 domain-containing protein [Chitinophagaceae bacterium]
MCILLGLFSVISCSKENSQERGTIDVPAGSDCLVTGIVPCDPVTGKGYGSFYIILGNDDKPTKSELFDSTSGSSYYKTDIVYKGDSMEVGDNGFFILDQERRITEFNTYEIAGDPGSDKFKYTYQYDAEGYLKNKSWYIHSVSAEIPSFVYTYTWLNGNLVKVEATEAAGARRTALAAELEYDFSYTVNNFIYCFPEANELAPFILSVNVGKKSKNLLTKIVVKTFNASGDVMGTYTTSYENYKFSSDGNITELYADGDAVDGMLIVDGLTKFKYQCK